MTRPTDNMSGRIGRRTGFTIIELLVVVTIIVLLVGITLVVTSRALRGAEVSQTRFLLNSIVSGIEQFHSDFGYYPPLLRDDYDPNDPERVVLEVQPNAGAELRRYRYFSTTSLTSYLIGVGRLEPSTPGSGNTDPARHDGVDGPGFRDPGPDHSWGGALDRTQNRPRKTGRIYGPYVDLGSGDKLRAVNSLDTGGGAKNEDNPRWPGLVLDQTMPLIVDTWGQPIRYYKPGWLKRDPSTNELTLDYTPIELINYEAITGGLNPELDPGVSSAPFLLLSAGPNKEFTGYRPSGAGGQGMKIAFEPMSLTETNTDLLEQFESSIGARDFMFDMLSDNIRVTP